MHLRENKTVKLKIADLEFDPLNPNTMTEAQEEGLEFSIDKYGPLDPIRVAPKNPKNGKYKIADGEHRARKLQEAGYKEIDAYIVPELITDAERRLLRQVFNKLHGQHEIGKDINELEYLLSQKKGDELVALLNIDNAGIDELKRLLEARSEETTGMIGGLPVDREASDALQEIDGPLGTTHKCPKCGYEY